MARCPTSATTDNPSTSGSDVTPTSWTGLDGQPVGATLGVVESVLSLLRDDGVTHLGCATDHVIHSWRNERYAGWKGDLGQQILDGKASLAAVADAAFDLDPFTGQFIETLALMLERGIHRWQLQDIADEAIHRAVLAGSS